MYKEKYPGIVASDFHINNMDEFLNAIPFTLKVEEENYSTLQFLFEVSRIKTSAYWECTLKIHYKIGNQEWEEAPSSTVFIFTEDSGKSIYPLTLYNIIAAIQSCGIFIPPLRFTFEDICPDLSRILRDHAIEAYLNVFKVDKVKEVTIHSLLSEYLK